MKKSLIRKFFEFAIGNGIILILGFISSPIITRIISPENMGKFSMFNTFASLFSIIVLMGLDQSYVRFFYEENEENRDLLLRICTKIPIKIFGVFSLVILICYKYISNFILGEVSITIILILLIHIFFTIIGRFCLLLIRMKQNSKRYSILQVSGKLLYLLGVIFIYILLKDNYIVLILSITISNVLLVGIAFHLERGDWLRKSKNMKLKVSNSELIKYGFPLVFSTAITWVFQSIDKIFINIYCGYNELGIYSAAFSIVALLGALKNTFITFWVPVANDKYINDKNAKIFFKNVNNLITVIMLSIGIILIGFKDTIVILLGDKYREAIYIFPFLIFSPIMYTISETTVMGIGFKKKNIYHIYISLICMIINIIGNIILIPSLAAKGAAISTGISYIIFFILRTKFSNKVYKVNYDILKSYISIILVGLFSLYSTLYKFDINMLIITIALILIILFIYRGIIFKVLKNKSIE